MTSKITIIMAAFGALWLVGDTIAQDIAEEAAQERRWSTNKEQVGPTIWRSRPHDTAYDEWFAKNKEHMPTFEGLMIQDARTEPLSPWEDMGVDGLYIKMADYQITDGWILEIPPHGQTNLQRHMFEAGMYFFGGCVRYRVKPSSPS